jgi:4'-phosphopantetheinyl transferase EntD
MTSHDTSLQHTIAALAWPGIVIGCRRIVAGDENGLTPEEASSIHAKVPAARRASGAVRILARELLVGMGLAPCPLPKSTSGAPSFPPGLTGSFAHDADFAVAALAKRNAVVGLGIDIEPAGPLPPDLLDVVATARERLLLGREPQLGRLLFVAKEAVYKAVNPLDGAFLEYHDIDVDFAAGRAQVRNGRTLGLRAAAGAHAIAVAVVAV